MTIYDDIKKDPLLGTVRRMALIQAIYVLEQQLQELLVNMPASDAADVHKKSAMHGAYVAAMQAIMGLVRADPDAGLEGRLGDVQWRCLKCRRTFTQRLRDYHVRDECPECNAKLTADELAARIRFDDGEYIVIAGPPGAWRWGST